MTITELTQMIIDQIDRYMNDGARECICGHHYNHDKECIYTIAKKIVAEQKSDNSKR